MKHLALGIMGAMLSAAVELPTDVPAKDARLSAREGAKHEYTMPHYADLAEWEQRKAHLKKQVLSAAGLFPMPERPPLRSQIFSRIERDGYTVEKVFLETLPGYYLGGNLYRPADLSGKFPAVLVPHGHWKRGRIENSELVSTPGLCINLARQGYVAFAYDMAGFNDTRQTKHEFGSKAEDLWTFHSLSLQTWNSLRAVDFVSSLPEVDPKRLAVTGASGGATQTFLLAAVDDRVQADIPVNMISSYMQGDSPCENASGLRHDTFNVELSALMAPRPMMVISATGDWTRHFPAIEFPAIRSIYQLYGDEGGVEQIQFDSPHNYHQGSREALYGFLAKKFRGVLASIHEEPFQAEKDEDLLVWADRPLPSNAVGHEGVFRGWRELTAAIDAGREALQYVLSVEIPVRTASAFSGESVAITRPGRGDRVTGIFHPGAGAPLLVIHAEGAEAGRRAEPAQGRPVLYLNPFPNTHHRLMWRFFTTYHRTDAQNRVQDILTAAAWLRSKYDGAMVEVHGIDRATVWATYAAAVDPSLRLHPDATTFTGTDFDFLRDFFVPGIRRVGGWPAAIRLTEGRRATMDLSGE